MKPMTQFFEMTCFYLEYQSGGLPPALESSDSGVSESEENLRKTFRANLC